MKIAKVVPIYKSSDKNTFINNRPLSLLPAVSKVLDKIVFRQLITFQTEHKIYLWTSILISPKTFYNSSHNTFAESIVHRHHLKNDQEVTLAILCDLSKAFDVINHDILLKKLNNYGIRGLTNDWFRSYLSEREQFVDIEGVHLNRVQLTIGVPQGSILGLFVVLTVCQRYK